MSATTIYDVKLRYLMEDRVTNSARAMDKQLRSAAGSASMLQGALGRVVGIAGGYLGFRAAKGALLDFNSSMEQSRITMAGLMQLNMGGEFAANMGKAEFLVSRFQERAKASVGTTKDFVDMASMLVQPLTMAKASMKDIEDLTAGAVVAARAFGIEADVAARDIDQAIRGQFRSVDPFSAKILGPAGFAGEDGRKKFNEMNVAQRLATMRRALTQKAVVDMAKAQETSLSGVISTLQDNLQMAFGKIGLPLFTRIKEEIIAWNKWLDKNKDRVDEISRKVGDFLVKGFEKVKSTTSWLIDHWKEIALIIGGIRLTQLGMGSFGGVPAALGAFSTQLGVATAATAALGLALNAAVSHFIDKSAEREQKASVADITLRNAFRYIGTGGSTHGIEQTKRALEMAGVVAKDGRLNKSKMADFLASTGHEQRANMANMLGEETRTQLWRSLQAGNRSMNSATEGGKLLAEAFSKRWEDIVQSNPHLFGQESKSSLLTPATNKTAKRPEVNITIQRIEVRSDDPDRFVFDLSETARRAVASTAAAHPAFGGR